MVRVSWGLSPMKCFLIIGSDTHLCIANKLGLKVWREIFIPSVTLTQPSIKLCERWFGTLLSTGCGRAGLCCSGVFHEHSVWLCMSTVMCWLSKSDISNYTSFISVRFFKWNLHILRLVCYNICIIRIFFSFFFRLAPARGAGRLAPAEEVLVCVNHRLSWLLQRSGQRCSQTGHACTHIPLLSAVAR